MKFRSLLLLLPFVFAVSCANKAKSDYDMTDPYGTGALDEFAGASAPDAATTTSAATTPLADSSYNTKAAYGDQTVAKTPSTPKTTYTPAPAHKPVAKKKVVEKKVVEREVVEKEVVAKKKPVVHSKKAAVKPVVHSKKKAVETKKPVVHTKKVVAKKIAKPVSHTVVRGDSLSRIADRQGVSVSALKKLNGLKSDVIRPGQKIRVK